MSKHLVDIDDDLLQEATVILGAPTMKETVNRALESVVVTDRRRRHAERLEAMHGLDLGKPKIMARAWR
jgi:Arc/MetJ family transcription regulator